jgi:holo-[acyl-carrier protein] synthase
MILGVGIDLVASIRIQELLNKFGHKFEAKIFTDLEVKRAQIINTADNNSLKALFYAKRFAAKEAFAKATGFGIGKNIGFKDIEIDNDELGRPFIRIPDICENFLCSHFKVSKININLSLTDESSLAQAIAIISK